jgi:hypothetical protein
MNLEINQIKIKFGKRVMTAYAGFSLLAGFLEKIHFREKITEIMSITEKSNNAMGIDAKVIGLLTTLLAGGKRFSHILHIGESANLLATIFKVKSIPRAGSSLTRGLFNKIKTFVQIRSIKEKCIQYLLEIIPWSKIKEDHLSFDSKVLVRYGNQVGAKKGYNKKKPGRKSHHPLVAFLSKSKYVLGINNRSGNKVSAAGVVKFFNNTYTTIKEKMNIISVLADSGFYLINFIESIEAKGLEYIIAAVISESIQAKLLEIKNWTFVCEGIDVSEFMFQHKDEKWTKDRRYVVIRQKKDILQDEAKGKQLCLFPEFDEFSEYKYSVLITNETAEPVNVWREYRQRPNDENTLKELQEDFGFDTFCMKKFWATETAMVIRVLLYNIFNLFREEILLTKDNPVKETLSTIRFKYLIIPGYLSFPARTTTLTMNILSKKLRNKIMYLINKVNQYVISDLSNCNAVEMSSMK